jgi:uncharacterized repeat protein (TIGR01451 family)
MGNLKLLIILALILAIPVSFPFDVSVSPEALVTKQGDAIEVELTITNNQQTDQFFTLSVPGLYSDWVTAPNSVTIPGQISGKVKIFVTPPRSLEPKVYGFNIILTSNPSGENQVVPINLRVIKKEGYFLKSLTLSKEDYSYNEPVVVTANVQSNEPEVADVSLTLKAEGPAKYAQTFVYTLPADQAKEFVSNFQMLDAPAGQYQITATLHRGLRTFDTKNFNIEVVPTVNVQQQKQSHFLFYKIATMIEVENTGNTDANNVQISDSIPTAWAILTSSTQPFKKSSTGFVWNIPILSPGDKKEISYEIALWPLYIIMILAAFGAYKTYARVGLPGIHKSIVQRGPLTRGGEARVMLHVKNRTGKTVKNVVIDDTLPASFQVVEASAPKPKIRVSSNGQNLRWNVGSLAPREERVLSYRVRQTMGVIGKIILPKAWMRADDSTYTSNEATAEGERERKTTK